MRNRSLAIINIFLSFSPLYALAALILLPDQDIYLFLGFLFLSMFAGMLIGYLTNKIFMLSSVIGIVVCSGFIVCIYLFSHLEDSILSQLISVVIGGILYVGYLQGQKTVFSPWYEAVPSSVSIAFLGVYSVLIIFIAAIKPFGKYGAVYAVLVILSAVSGIYLMNRNSIMIQINRNLKFKKKKRSSQPLEAKTIASINAVKTPVSPSLKRQNIFIVVVMFMLVVAVTPVLGFGLGSAGNALVDALNNRIEESEEIVKPIDDEIQNPQFTVTDNKAPNETLSMIYNILSITFFSFFAFLLLYATIKKFRSFIKKLAGAFSGKRYRKKKATTPDVAEDDELYEEIVEQISVNLFNGKKFRDIVREKIGWSAMRTEEERIRYLYRHTVRKASSKGYHPRKYKTAFETLGEIAYSDQDKQHESSYRALADAYNKTRYDMSPPSDGYAAKIRGELK